MHGYEGEDKKAKLIRKAGAKMKLKDHRKVETDPDAKWVRLIETPLDELCMENRVHGHAAAAISLRTRRAASRIKILSCLSLSGTDMW